MNIFNSISIFVTILSSLISLSFCYYNFYSERYRNYGRQYGAYRPRKVPGRSYGRGYGPQSFGELHHKPIVYPSNPAGFPKEVYPLEQFPISPGVEPDYNWYNEKEYKQMFQSYPKKYSTLFEGMTFYSKSKPIYVEKKPIIKIIKQPVFIKQPIVIHKQPVIHKEEVVTVDKKPAVVTEIKVPEISVKPGIDKKIDEEKQIDERKLDKEKAEKEGSGGKPVVIEKPVGVEKQLPIDKPAVEVAKPGVALGDKNIKQEQKNEKKPLPELEDP